MTTPADARHFSLAATLRNGTPITIRAVRPDDGPRIEKAFAQLERETIYTRFFRFRSALSAAELASVATVDFVRDVLLVATIASGNDEIVIAGGSYHAHDERDGSLSAEVAFTVEEDYQGQGLAGRLIDALTGIARKAGIARFVAEVLPVNKAMLAVFARTGLPTTERREEDVVHVTLDLSPPV
jgi:RimJ/RimL family protein N-acetyltransferase